MPSNDANDEVWDRLRRQLEAAGRVTLAESLLPKSDHSQAREGFTNADIAMIVSFFVNVSEGDARKAIVYAKRFEKITEDRLFGRAVRVAVERKLNT